MFLPRFSIITKVFDGGRIIVEGCFSWIGPIVPVKEVVTATTYNDILDICVLLIVSEHSAS